MNIEERVVQAIDTYNRVITVMSPNTVYMGYDEYLEAKAFNAGQSFEQFMGMQVVQVNLTEYLQVARVEPAKCCTPTNYEKRLLESGDYTPEELWGGKEPTCPKCIGDKS